MGCIEQKYAVGNPRIKSLDLNPHWGLKVRRSWPRLLQLPPMFYKSVSCEPINFMESSESLKYQFIFLSTTYHLLTQHISISL